MRTCTVCDAEIPDDAHRCGSCDAPVPMVRPIVTDESSLPNDVQREIDDARRQLLIPRPVDRSPKARIEDAGRAVLIAAGGLLLAMTVAWMAFRVL